MALTGHLSDLSLSELIEFFCNQRKSGRLKVLYPNGAGYFYLQAGSVVDARIGILHGIDAVYYALTLPNAEFEFSADAEPVNRTINQPWTQVVLEGLRRLDEGIAPGTAFPAGFVQQPDELEVENETTESSPVHKSFAPAFLTFGKETQRRKPLFIGAIAFAVVASVAVVGVPAGWYRHSKAETPAASLAPSNQPTPNTTAETSSVSQPATDSSSHTDDAAALAAKRQRDKEKAKAREAAVRAENAPIASGNESRPGPKRVVVTVSYDESGRVTQASGGDANALRIARQKRFPAGKAGTATVTIPIN